jgi:hypothetical protein
MLEEKEALRLVSASSYFDPFFHGLKEDSNRLQIDLLYVVSRWGAPFSVLSPRLMNGESPSL